MSKTIETTHEVAAAALRELADRIDNMQPVLLALGEDMTERTKQRFATATAPDGTRWKPNTQATLIAYLNKRGGFSKKTGKITARGQKLATGKRPLQGESGDLARQIFYEATDESLTLGSSMRYARMQQFGGQKSEFPHLWGDIPARPFLPVTAGNELAPTEAEAILERIRQYLLD